MNSVVQNEKTKIKGNSSDKMLEERPVSPTTPKESTDELFDEGNDVCGVLNKICIVDEDDEDFCHQVVSKFKCDVPNCDLMFDNLLKYELHYNSCHRFSCSVCRKHLPSPHLLDLHLSESHDSFFLVLAKRKPMYRCYVESCQVVSESAAARKKHCIEAHKFPHDFYFGSKKKKTQEPKKTASTPPKNKKPPPDSDRKMEIEGNSVPSESLPTLKSKPVAKPLTPKPETAKQTFTFGRKTGGKAFSKKSKKPDSKIEMGDLMDTLPTD